MLNIGLLTIHLIPKIYFSCNISFTYHTLMVVHMDILSLQWATLKQKGVFLALKEPNKWQIFFKSLQTCFVIVKTIFGQLKTKRASQISFHIYEN